MMESPTNQADQVQEIEGKQIKSQSQKLVSKSAVGLEDVTVSKYKRRNQFQGTKGLAMKHEKGEREETE